MCQGSRLGSSTAGASGRGSCHGRVACSGVWPRRTSGFFKYVHTAYNTHPYHTYGTDLHKFTYNSFRMRSSTHHMGAAECLDNVGILFARCFMLARRLAAVC
eukprot:363243-Chlamydomonas_euryale.AAC.4